MMKLHDCPFCGTWVEDKGSNTGVIDSGRGKFRRKQLYHRSCYEDSMKKKKVMQQF